MTASETPAGATHTPGPWIVGMAGDNRPAVYPTDKRRRAPICTMATGAFDEWEPLPNHEANARLIAAAPELLEALKSVLRVADRKTVEFDKARAAIAKAEGHQP